MQLGCLGVAALRRRMQRKAAILWARQVHLSRQ